MSSGLLVARLLFVRKTNRIFSTPPSTSPGAAGTRRLRGGCAAVACGARGRCAAVARRARGRCVARPRQSRGPNAS